MPLLTSELACSQAERSPFRLSPRVHPDEHISKRDGCDRRDGCGRDTVSRDVVESAGWVSGYKAQHMRNFLVITLRLDVSEVL